MKRKGISRLAPAMVLVAACWLLLVSGCANINTGRARDPAQAFWQGRLAVKVTSDPPQAFSANFALQGSATQGSLALTSLLGTRLATLQWNADTASLQTPQESLQFASVDAMVAHSVGTPLPMAALFAWLHGDTSTAAGWAVDLQDWPAGRIRAWRLAPDAAAEIKIILDPG